MALSRSTSTPAILALVLKIKGKKMSVRKGNDILAGNPVVDNVLSTTSENPVQNKVITTALNTKAETSSLATVATTGNYNDLSNKPAIPTVNNGVLTISRNYNVLGTFSANTSNNLGINITVPEKTSDLTNDSGFISGITQSMVINAIGYTPYNESNPQGYQANVLETVKVNGTSLVITNKSVNVIVPEKTSDLTNDSGYIAGITSTMVVNALGYTPVNANLLATVATTGSYNDLRNKPTIPAAQVNSDWNAVSGVAQILNKPTLSTVATSGSYNDLSNKPSIPTVNNATLTIQKNGTTVNTFTANSSSDVTANISVPTKTSDITNDSGYITNSVNDLVNYTLTSSLSAVATSGAYSDLSGTPNLATVATSGSYNDLSNKPTIPAAQVNSDWNSSSGLSEILNKPNLATVATTGAYSDLSGTPNLSTVATSGSYNDLSNKPTIPTVNDATITVTQGGTTKGTFTLNQSSNTTISLDGGQDIQIDTLPDAQLNIGRIIQWKGNETTLLKKGYFYKATAIQVFTANPTAEGWSPTSLQANSMFAGKFKQVVGHNPECDEDFETIYFVYDGSSWSFVYQNTIEGDDITVNNVNLSEYGISYTGTPVSGCKINITVSLSFAYSWLRIDVQPTSVSPLDYIVDMQLPSAANNYSWYRKYNSGFVEQGGIFTQTQTAKQTVNLLVEMQNANYQIWANVMDDNLSNYVFDVKPTDRTTTTFKSQVWGSYQYGIATSGYSFVWHAYGMAA